ncbi:11243_t:CDS:1, partial [Paraglomus brasilianum]
LSCWLRNFVHMTLNTFLHTHYIPPIPFVIWFQTYGGIRLELAGNPIQLDPGEVVDES